LEEAVALLKARPQAVGDAAHEGGIGRRDRLESGLPVGVEVLAGDREGLNTVLAQQQLEVVAQIVEGMEEEIGREIHGGPLAQRAPHLTEVVVKADDRQENLADRSLLLLGAVGLKLLVKAVDLGLLEAIACGPIADLLADRGQAAG
jgi:hypothetical protein